MASSGSESEYEVESILESRRRGRIVEYKVRWKNFGEDEDSWEPEKSLMQTAPLFIEQFKKKGGTTTLRTRNSRSKQVKTESDIDQDLAVTASSSSTKTTRSGSSTTTTTTTFTKLESFSDASDAEDAKVTRTTRTTVTKSSSGDSNKTGGAARKSWFPRFSMPACASCACLQGQLPFIIYATCMLFIAATFAYEKL